MNKKVVICPTCNNECFFCLDEWGRTPWHLHCDNCHINIGATSCEKGEELLKQYHESDTWIEFYGNKIHILCIKGDFLINE